MRRGGPTFSISGEDVQRLADFNSERARGLMHTVEYTARMAELQARFDADRRRWHESQGHIEMRG